MSETPPDVARREFLFRTLVGGAAGAALLGGCASGVSRSGESPAPGSEAVTDPLFAELKPGEHTLLELPYPKDGLVLPDPDKTGVKGISAQVVTWHHDKHHAGYVKALNEIEKSIAGMQTIEAKANYSPFTELKRRETFNASGMYLHDVYWLNLTPGGQTITEDLPIHRKLVHDFGSYERWCDEFIGTAKTPNAGWAILALTPFDLRLHNYACSFHDLGGVWGAMPLIALDVWEHAYYYDYGPDRGKYIESFLKLLDWEAVNARYERWAAAEKLGVRT